MFKQGSLKPFKIPKRNKYPDITEPVTRLIIFVISFWFIICLKISQIPSFDIETNKINENYWRKNNSVSAFFVKQEKFS